MRKVKGPLDELIDTVGGVGKLANQLGVDRKTVFLWQDKDPDTTGKLKVNILCRALNIQEIYKD